jgi:hypothetical protein
LDSHAVDRSLEVGMHGTAQKLTEVEEVTMGREERAATTA